MKSKQVNFYLTPNDQEILLQQIGEVYAYTILSSICCSSTPEILHSAQISEMGKDRLRIYLARHDDVTDVIASKVNEQPYFAVEQIMSPVVEFTRCYFDNNILRRGRFYFIYTYYEGVQSQRKNNNFIEWANGILNLSKKLLAFNKNEQAYYGGEALILAKSGTIKFLI